MENNEINPTAADGEWFDTREELVVALRAELDSLERRRAYIQELLDEATAE